LPGSCLGSQPMQFLHQQNHQQQQQQQQARLPHSFSAPLVSTTCSTPPPAPEAAGKFPSQSAHMFDPFDQTGQSRSKVQRRSLDQYVQAAEVYAGVVIAEEVTVEDEEMLPRPSTAPTNKVDLQWEQSPRQPYYHHHQQQQQQPHHQDEQPMQERRLTPVPGDQSYAAIPQPRSAGGHSTMRLEKRRYIQHQQQQQHYQHQQQRQQTPPTRPQALVLERPSAASSAEDLDATTPATGRAAAQRFGAPPSAFLDSYPAPGAPGAARPGAGAAAAPMARARASADLLAEVPSAAIGASGGTYNSGGAGGGLSSTYKGSHRQQHQHQQPPLSPPLMLPRAESGVSDSGPFGGLPVKTLLRSTSGRVLR
jgi:hypothetical protein